MDKTTIPGNMPEGEKPQEFVIPAQYGAGSEPCKTLQDLVDEGAVKSPWMDEFDRSAILVIPRLRDHQVRAVAEAFESPSLRYDQIMRASMPKSASENLALDSVEACNDAARALPRWSLLPLEEIFRRKKTLMRRVFSETRALHSFGDGNRQLAVMGQNKIQGLLSRRWVAGRVGDDDACRIINKRRRDALAHSAKWLARWKESRNGF